MHIFVFKFYLFSEILLFVVVILIFDSAALNNSTELNWSWDVSLEFMGLISPIVTRGADYRICCSCEEGKFLRRIGNNGQG